MGAADYAGAAAHFREALARDGTTNATLLNNLAVALEALGRYDEALATYKQALQTGSKPTPLRRNYARFAEFYTSYAKGVKPKETNDAPH